MKKGQVGDTAEVLPEAPVGGSYQAKVAVVDQVFEAASGTIGGSAWNWPIQTFACPPAFIAASTSAVFPDWPRVVTVCPAGSLARPVRPV